MELSLVSEPSDHEAEGGEGEEQLRPAPTWFEHKLFRPGTEVFLRHRRDSLAAQIGDSLGHM